MGVTARLPERPYTELSDDARVRHYSQMSPDTWRDLELKLAIALRYHDEVKLAAMRGERTLGAQMVSQGHGGPRQTGHPLDEFDAMDSRIHASVAGDDAEMETAVVSTVVEDDPCVNSSTSRPWSSLARQTVLEQPSATMAAPFEIGAACFISSPLDDRR